MTGIPLISQLLRSIIVEDYAKSISIITDKDFNPNECNASWGAPVLTSIITVLSDNNTKIIDNKSFKEILKEIAKHKDFDPNKVDSEGETILMHMARRPKFNWFAPFILCNKKVDLEIKNFRKATAIDIAEKNGNTVLADILLGYNGRNHDGMPKKRVGIKKSAKSVNICSNVPILERIEYAFEDDAKKNPVSLYNLLVNFFKGNYSFCIQIIKDVNFDPNEHDKWEEPALSSLIYYSQDANVEYDENEYKKIVDAIISLPRFNVNALDADCNTAMMVAMGFPKLRWLTEKLFNIASSRIDITNDQGETIRTIAKSCGNEEFYDDLIKKSFQTVEAID